MTVREKMLSIIEQYCEMHGIKRETLFESGNHKGAKKKRNINGVPVATLRMALAYYLSNNFPVSLTDVAHLVGYADHSTISYNNKKIYFYLKNQDKYFLYFYNPLVELGNLYEPVKFQRISRLNYEISK